MEVFGGFTLALLRDITTPDALLDAVEKGALKCDVVDAAMVAGRLHIAAGVHRTETTNPRVRSRLPSAPLMAGLSPKTSNALKLFSLGGRLEGPRKPTAALIAVAGGDTASTLRQVQALAGGRIGSLSDLGGGASATPVAACL